MARPPSRRTMHCGTADGSMQMAHNWNGFRGSVTAKLVVIAGIMLLLLVPLTMTERLIVERSDARTRAALDVAASWGYAQTVGGPVLVLPFRYSVRDRQGVTRRVEDELYVLPRELTIEGGADTQVLTRGIYRIPVYSAPLSVTGTLRSVALDPATFADLELLWQSAEILLPLADPRALREAVTLALDGEAIAFGPGDEDPWLGPVLSASLADVDPTRFDEEQAFSLALAIAGTGGLHFRPDGDFTQVSLSSAWASPSFRGAYLPESREVTSAGFAADWRVLAVGRGYASTWLGSDRTDDALRTELAPLALAAAAADRAAEAAARNAALRGAAVEPSRQPPAAARFGVEFLVPVDVHTSSLRAIKYAELYLAVTFAAFFLFEAFAKAPLHPVQYLSVGLANGSFYLLLLALAEHAGFGPAYVASATAATALIGGYAAAILGSTRRALPITGLIIGLYAYLYTTLRAEDYALVVGALGLFALLSAFMYLTRRVDWYSLELAGAPDPAAPRAERAP